MCACPHFVNPHRRGTACRRHIPVSLWPSWLWECTCTMLYVLSLLCSMGAALDAITVLFERHAGLLGDDAAREVVRGLTDTHVPSLDQPLRHASLSLLRHLLRTPRWVASLSAQQDGLSAAEAASHFGTFFVLAMEGEKDPRCLVVALEAAQRVLHAFAGLIVAAPGGDDVLTELFDVTACYFPITFTPPPNDPHGITQAQLSGLLLSVFTATPLLAAHAMPLFFEKLTSTVTTSKLEAIAGISAAATAYGPRGIRPFLAESCDMLREEVVKGTEGDVAAAATAAIRVLAQVASQDVQSSGDGW